VAAAQTTSCWIAVCRVTLRHETMPRHEGQVNKRHGPHGGRRNIRRFQPSDLTLRVPLRQLSPRVGDSEPHGLTTAPDGHRRRRLSAFRQPTVDLVRDCLGCFVVKALDDALVGVAGEGGRGVAELVGDDLDVDARVEGDGGGSVPQVVESDRRESRALDEAAEALADRRRVARLSVGADEECARDFFCKVSQGLPAEVPRTHWSNFAKGFTFYV
jgi:hypothetical protein